MDVEIIDILNTNDSELMEISRKRQLSLNLEEMKKIREYYAKLKRNPTDIELETFAQTWSEHCLHKTFKGKIITEEGTINNLLKSTIAKVTEELNLDWCFSVFEDNAGIVDFEGDIAIAFKVETHNHPSALEPFGGASTGVGGVIRDILGVWGEPIANTDVLCFGPLDYPYEKLPEGIKHPKFIFNYVISGIGHYGNNIGIPTVNGAILFDEGYIGNPLVYCGTVGIVLKSKYKREVKEGDAILLVGGKTGRDGIHGVTFASAELDEESEEVSITAVQIGDPIEEEKIKRAILKVRDLELASGITDLGGGGLSSAVGETANRYNLGAEVYLDRVPLKYANMKPWEIWCSESQERMLLAVPTKNLEKVIEIFEEEEVEATCIGKFIGERKLKIFFKNEKIAEIDMNFLFSPPKTVRIARYTKKNISEPQFEEDEDLTPYLLKILSSPNVASKENVIRTYDHEVKALTIIKPLQGKFNDSPGDAAVLKPLYDSWKGISISNGINPLYGKIDTYWMAASAIDEAIRNNIAVGGRRIALLDNFCWGNPEKPDRLGNLVRAAKACYDIAKGYGTPFISGKDSLYNESPLGEVTPTLLISALGIVPDVRKAITMDLKSKNSFLYILGFTYNELGGSHYYKVRGYLGKNVPKVRIREARETFDRLIGAMDNGFVLSCHDISEGGIAVASAEMAFAGDIGVEISIEKIPKEKMREDYAIFSESNSRFLVEVHRSKASKFEELMRGITFSKIGKTTAKKELVMYGEKKERIREELSTLKDKWRNGIQW